MPKNKELIKQAQEAQKLRQIMMNIEWMSNDMKRKIPEIEELQE